MKGKEIDIIGKLPPQAVELEEAVIGAVLLESEAMGDVAEILRTPQMFYKDAHQRIWTAIAALYQKHSPIDILTVTDQLRKNGDLETAGGALYVSQLSNKVGSAANAEYHARIIAEKYIQRQLIAYATEIQKEAYEDTTDVLELTDRATDLFQSISMNMNSGGQRSFYNIVVEESDNLKAAALSKDHITGVPTCSPTLDRALLGFQPKNLIILAGRPGMGKTSVAWQIAINQAKRGIPVGFFSLEMGDAELVHKMFSAETSIANDVMRKGALSDNEWRHFDSKMDDMANLPIYLNDNAGLTINQIVAIAKNWVRKHDVKAIYIDYIGKIQVGEKRFGTREQEVSHVSGKLKDLAKTLKIPVIALSQLSRAVEQRGGDKRPILSDLRESGAIEQDADVVIFCYRPEYYGIENGEDGQPYPQGYTELDIAKYRNGKIGTARWIFEAKYSRFYDYG